MLVGRVEQTCEYALMLLMLALVIGGVYQQIGKARISGHRLINAGEVTTR